MWKSVRTQTNANVQLVVWYRRWRGKESGETRANVYRRRSCESRVKLLTLLDV